MQSFQWLAVKAVLRVVRFPRLTLAICLLALVAAVGGAWTHLDLSTDQNELMTPKLPFFRDYIEFTRQFPENESLVVIIEPAQPAHPPPARRWIELADRISEGLLALQEDVRRVDVRVAPEELGVHALTFADWEELRAQSAYINDLVRLGRIVGDPESLEALAVGGLFGAGDSPTRRLLAALSAGPPAEGRGLAVEAFGSLASALATPPQAWVRGKSPGEGQLPSLVNADPRVATDPSMHGYILLRDETKRHAGEAYLTEKIMAINVYAQRTFASLEDVTGPLQRIREVALTAARDFPDFKPPVVSGRPALEADEVAVSEQDTRKAEILGLSLVFIVLFLFLRNLWLVIVAELCLGVSIGWTFGWATLAVGRLNLLSLVFVIAMIGIGIDYLIQILTRYRFEKKRYSRSTAIWARVFRYVSPPISTACFGAAGAFFVALLTNFQGAAELGLIAGGGLLLCLISGYTLLPALLTLFPADVGRVPESRRYRLNEPDPAAGGRRLIPAALWILVAGAGLWWSLPPHFDPNLLKLQADELPSVREVRKLPTWYAVVTSRDPARLEMVRAAMGDADVIERTESILDAREKRQWLVDQNAGRIRVNWKEPAAPRESDLRAIADAAENLAERWRTAADAGDLSDVRAAGRRLAGILRDADLDAQTKLTRLARWQNHLVEELRHNVTQFAPPPLDESALPESLRDHLMSDTGPQRVYALYIHPKADLWEQGALEEFVHVVQARFDAIPDRGDLVLTGIAPQLLQSTREIHRAFLLSTIYALGLIFVLVWLDLRRLGQTLLAISVLGLGLPMLLLMMVLWRSMPLGGQTLEEWTGIPGSWNFANFFALPILIGAGHEYGVFMVHRYREALHDPRRVWRTWDVSDRALLLCAIVTSATFGFLVVARHHGLQSLGWIMAVGAGCVYLSTVLVLRPILLWRLKHKQVYKPNHAAVDGNGQKRRTRPT